MASVPQKAQEIYESPDVPEDEIEDIGRDSQAAGTEDGSIVASQLDPTESFKKFSDAILDNRGKDFSDSIGKKSSFANRTRFEVVKGTQGEKDVEDVLETPLQRFERLRLEVTNFLKDIENIRTAKQSGSSESAFTDGNNVSSFNAIDSFDSDFEGVSLLELTDQLRKWQIQLQQTNKVDGGLNMLLTANPDSSVGTRLNMQSDVTSQLIAKVNALKLTASNTGSSERQAAATSAGIPIGDTTSSPSTKTPGTITYQLHYRKDTSQLSKLHHIAELERRLSTLEQVVTGTISPDIPEVPNATGLIKSIDELKSKVNSLDERAFDQLAHRMIKLTKHFDALKSTKETASHLSEDQETKLDQVYSALCKVELVADDLPTVAERLVQLKKLHTESLQFASQLHSISNGQEQLTGMISANKHSIENLQQSLATNMATVERNVQLLEKRISDVSGLLASK